MHRRSDIMALCALILATIACAATLRPYLSAFAAGPSSPDDPNAVAAIPSTFNYQGTLRNAAGLLVTASVNMTLRIYAEPIGGTPLHGETFTNVAVRDGLFNVVLGDRTAIPANVFADAPRYVGIQVSADPEMEPRQRLHPVPWAQQATTAVNATNATNATNAGTASTLIPFATVPGLRVQGNGGGLRLEGTDHNYIEFYPQGVGAGRKGWIGYNIGSPNIDIVNENPNGRIGLWTRNTEPILMNNWPIVLIKRYKNVGNDANFNTGTPANLYECVMTSWFSRHDWDENGTDVNRLWTYVSGGTWWAQAQFHTDGSGENPHVDVLCFRKEFAYWEGFNGATRELNTP